MLSLASCGESGVPRDSLTDAQRAKIEKYCLNNFYYAMNWYDESSVYALRYYGNYGEDDAVPVFCQIVPPTSKNDELNKLTVYDYSFSACGAIDLGAICDGTVYTLKQAYQKKYITDDELKEISKVHESALSEYRELGLIDDEGFATGHPIEWAWATRGELEPLSGDGFYTEIADGELYYYGNYGGADVLVCMRGVKYSMSDRVSVGGIDFVYGLYPFEIHVYANGAFSTLNEAYDAGIITDAELAEIKAFHDANICDAEWNMPK